MSTDKRITLITFVVTAPGTYEATSEQFVLRSDVLEAAKTGLREDLSECNI